MIGQLDSLWPGQASNLFFGHLTTLLRLDPLYEAEIPRLREGVCGISQGVLISFSLPLFTLVLTWRL